MLLKNRMNIGTKILILVPGKDSKGGISNYYNALRFKFSMNIEYFLRGSRNWPIRKNFFIEAFRVLSEFYLFRKKLNDKEISIVMTNTSLDVWDIIRDYLFVSIAYRKKKKVIIFFRGWSIMVQDKISKHYLWAFKRFINKSTCCIVLSNKNKELLREWGYEKLIFVETTLVDDSLLETTDPEKIHNKYNCDCFEINILFLSRVEINKGIYEAYNTYKILRKEYPYMNFIVAGDGFELEGIKGQVKKDNIDRVRFIGFVRGEEKIKVFHESHILLFTSYEEGMPNAVLEAMAFGIPVVTTNVGGLRDFFIDKKNGYIVSENNPQILSEKIKELIVDKELLLEISRNNFLIAGEKFYSSKVVKRLEDIYSIVLNTP